MPKQYKIKRYKHIYRNSRFSAGKFAVFVLVLAALGFLAVSLYRPVRDFLSGKTLAQIQTPASEPSAPPAAPVPESSAADPDPVPPPAPPAPPAALADLHAVYIPPTALLSGGAVDFARAAGLEDANTVVIDCKNSAGEVLYQSRLEAVAGTEAAHGSAFDLPAVTRELQAAGYRVIGRVCAFKDPIAAREHRGAAVGYRGANYIWLDNTVEAGGQPWLNPYSTEARGYVADIAGEVARAGVDAVLLDAVHFPDGGGQDLADFGPDAGAEGRDTVLSGFAAGLSEQLAGLGSGAIFCVDASDFLKDATQRYGATDPARLFGDTLAVRMMPELFGTLLEYGGELIDNPAANPYEAVRAVTGFIRPSLPAETTLIPLLQGYTAEEYGKIYGGEQVAQQVRALDEAGIRDYIVLYER